MKLSQLAAKPQLIKIVLDDQEIRDTYGDALEFYVYDRQNMETFIKLATLDTKDINKLTDLINTLILDESGEPIVKDGMILPTDVLIKAIQTVVIKLGKHQKPISTTSIPG
jgi:hypothetical protein